MTVPPPPNDRRLVLVVEDEPAIADLVVLHLERAGFATLVERDGDAALAAVARHTPAVVVLDIGLPGRDGIEVCRLDLGPARARARGPRTRCSSSGQSSAIWLAAG